MKRGIILALVCLNAALIVALVFGTTSRPAYGQVTGADYILMTGNISGDYDAVYVLDLATRRLGAWRFDRTRKRLIQGRGRELARDFRRSSGL